MVSRQDLSLFQVGGEPYDIGYRLGELARPVFADYMEQSSAWRAVRRWRGDPFVQQLREAAQAHWQSVALSQRLPSVTRPLLRLPALWLLPGDNPAQLAK